MHNRSLLYRFVLINLFILHIQGANQCFHFPHDFFYVNVAKIANGTCRVDNNTQLQVHLWNKFLHKQFNYLKLRLCIDYKNEHVIVNSECSAEVDKRLSALLNNPQCCNALSESGRFSCYFDVHDPCNEITYKYEKYSYFHKLCERRYKCQTGKYCDLSVNNGYLHYHTAGCASTTTDLPQYKALGKYNDATRDFLDDQFCKKSANQRNCCKSHLCNLPHAANSFYKDISIGKDLTLFKENDSIASYQLLVILWVGLIILGVALLAVGIVVSVIIYKGCNKQHYKEALISKSTNSEGNSSEKLMSVSSPVTASSTQGDTQPSTFASYMHNDESSHTGSGAGTPILVPRTVAREIALGTAIGQGRFGQVLYATWRGDAVAVKIFSSRAESSWSTEGRIYALPGMRHDNILGFIAIDNIDTGWETQLWLITDYHAHGSLQSYLTNNTIDIMQFAKMAAGIANGVSYLHTEIRGVKSKPSIAHRDIKSNNILVKSDLTCCIADFGLAVEQKYESSQAWDSRVGTKRYLSPECLDGSIAFGSFISLLQSDIYSLGLVLWELGMRCYQPLAGVEPVSNYEQPYQSLVSVNPSIEEMASVVCKPANIRPALPNRWLECPVLGPLCRLLTECWYSQPSARLASLHVKCQTALFLSKAKELSECSKAECLTGNNNNTDNKCTVLA